MTSMDHQDADSCWGCRTEAGDDFGLGAACRARLAARTPAPHAPAVNALIEKLDDVYAHLCWHCQCALAVGIDGLCGRCRVDLRG